MSCHQVSLSVILSVCLSVCLCANYCKSNQPISLKLGVMNGPTARRNNWVTFGGYPIPDMAPTPTAPTSDPPASR